MAPLRLVDPQGLYHVMSRGNFRQTIFPTADHANRYLKLLDRVAKRRRWIVVDWCLMPNHFHLLIQLTEGGLSEGMRELNGCYSRWSNAIHDRTGTGHLVRNRFKSRQVTEDEYLWTLLRYIPMNPVLAELCAAPEHWPWSGYLATIGHEYPRRFHLPDEILQLFHRDPAIARRRYIRHVTNGPVADSHDLWSDHNELPQPGAA